MLCSREAGCGLEDTGRDLAGEAQDGSRAIQGVAKEAGIGDGVTGIEKNIKLVPAFLAASFISLGLSLW